MTYSVDFVSVQDLWAPELTPALTGLLPMTSGSSISTDLLGRTPLFETSGTDSLLLELSDDANVQGYIMYDEAGYGPRDDFAPQYDVLLSPGELTQATLNGYAAGTRYGITGFHRQTGSVIAKAGDSFLGLPGATLNGARLLTSWVADSGLWYHDGITAGSDDAGVCRLSNPYCRRPNDIYVDDVNLWEVNKISEVGEGSFYFDRTAGRVWIADNPAGRTVEITSTQYAITPSGNDVTIENLVIEKFATPGQDGVIKCGLRTGWKILDNEIRFNHGCGIDINRAGLVKGNNIHHNGQMGIHSVGAVPHSDGSVLLIEKNEIAFNNTEGYSSDWEAGGAKWTRSDGVVVRRNWVHDNDGTGLWTDIYNIRTLYEDNLIEDNADAGIFHEISHSATIRRNTCRRNGFRDIHGAFHAGIQISTSVDAEVYDNLCEFNARGIVGIMQDRSIDPYGNVAWGPHGPQDLVNCKVHDNRVVMGAGQLSGLFQDITSAPDPFTAKGDQFYDNTYVVPDVGSYWMFGAATGITFATFQSKNQDSAGQSVIGIL